MRSDPRSSGMSRSACVFRHRPMGLLRRCRIESLNVVPSVSLSLRFTMFDITGHDISLLSDEDLRALIGRLCEAELRRHSLSPLAVTWGGHQNATDGGIDVRVAAETMVPATSAILRSNVGFQVKAEDMPRGKILAEMRPDDILRASIQELATLRGSYIIVSSKGSVSYTALRERKRAMKDAVVDLPNPNDLHLDFYDRDRVATWVRDHHGIATWSRERIGRPIAGWRSYEDWAGSQEGVTGEYLVDNQLRIQGPHLKGDSLPALEGMERRGAEVRETRQRTVRVIDECIGDNRPISWVTRS